VPKRYGQACPVAKSLEVVGDRWTLLLVRDLLSGPRRFYSAHPPRAEYELTDRGRELGVVVGALASWGTRHVHRSSALVHDACGHPVEMKYFCRHCATRVGGSTVRIGRRRRGAPAPARERR